jgi:hypothetical protein
MNELKEQWLEFKKGIIIISLTCNFAAFVAFVRYVATSN